MNKVVGLVALCVLVSACGQGIPNSTRNDAGLTPNQLEYKGGGDVYYTGYDGTPNYETILYTSREITSLDPSIVLAVKESAIIPPTELDALVILIKTSVLSPDQRRWVGRRIGVNDINSHVSGSSSTVQYTKLVPQAPGIGYLEARRQRSDGSYRWDTHWRIPEIRTVVVNAYNSAQIEQGKARYESGFGASQACNNSGCHGQTYDTSGNFAPSHQLGRVMEVPDSIAVQWITTGQAQDRAFPANLGGPAAHSHAFSSNEEAYATVAYLRSTQTKNGAELRELWVKQMILEAQSTN